jgi:exodeoxyribonuclease V beta subunit
MSQLDVLAMPLQGRQVIEASAGTGKTWTLAALYLRLVLGHGRIDAIGLKPSQILVMTFTDAATAELRERIRQRLGEAAHYLDDVLAERTPKADPFLHDLSQALTQQGWAQAAAQCHAAAQNMDDAAIFTIHAWSRRMLSSFALQSRDLFEQTHLDNPSDLLHDLVNDHWRRWFYPLPLEAQPLLQEAWQGEPQKLLADIQKIWQNWDRQPRPANNKSLLEPQAVWDAYLAWLGPYQAQEQLSKQAWHSEVAQALLAAQANKHMKGSRADYFANWVGALQAWAEKDRPIPLKTLERFGLAQLQDKGWPQAQEHPVFGHIDDLLILLKDKPAYKDALAAHAAVQLRQAYQQAKLQQSVFDFQDLLQRLHQALHADQGEMAAAIRAQYPVAMVDEFQDTDPWQYQSLDRIFDTDCVEPHNALVMIGDPKQAIYSFRGADLSTYLQARDAALTNDPKAVHSLSSNFRSAPSLVRALNHVFGQVPQLFAKALGDIDYVSVNSQSKEQPLSGTLGRALKPLNVLYLPVPPDSEKVYWAAPPHLHHMAEGFASTMVNLLQQHSDIAPGDMAVLVRSHAHAKAMQVALRARQLPSVFLSDNANVYQSEEALDLWRVLRAVATPRQTSWMRSALVCRLWGFSNAQLPVVLQDLSHADVLAESGQRWLAQWQKQGVLPMLYSWIHEQHIASRLLAMPEGERRLTNLLHLGELLQDASQHLQGPEALLHYLQDQLLLSSSNPETQKMRLETDAQCVQIITFHKSKGLEYPLVFVPFLGSFSAQEKGSSKPADDDEEAPDITETTIDEDMRLLYVALTRAKRGLWLGIAHTKSAVMGSKGKEVKLSAVSRLLQRQSRDDLEARLHAAWGPCEDIAISSVPTPERKPYQSQRVQTQAQAALSPKRTAHKFWWTASFSSLTLGLETDSSQATNPTNPSANDGALSSSLAWQSFPAGARYGTLLHDLLQYQAQNAWPLALKNTPTSAAQDKNWQGLVKRKTDYLQLPSPAQAMLLPWLEHIISSPLPLMAADSPLEALAAPLVLQQLQPEQMWAEMEFSLPVGQLSSMALDGLIQRHVLPGQGRPALQAKVMQGMLTGFMDLVLQHEGRFWVLDYKSNLLADYQAQSLSEAVLAKRYEVQYVLYTLALHRLLQSRLPDYNYEQHMGGAIYLFLRGIDSPQAGVHALRPAWALIDQLGSLFAKAAP